MFGTVFINCHNYIHGVIFAVPGFQSKCESCTFFTVKMKCAYHTNGVLYGTVGVLITILLW